jgi:hypothetical protein
MKKPLFCEIERRIIHEDKSIFASQMKLHFAVKKFERELAKTTLGKIFKKLIK